MDLIEDYHSKEKLVAGRKLLIEFSTRRLELSFVHKNKKTKHQYKMWAVDPVAIIETEEIEEVTTLLIWCEGDLYNNTKEIIKYPEDYSIQIENNNDVVFLTGIKKITDRKGERLYFRVEISNEYILDPNAREYLSFIRK